MDLHAVDVLLHFLGFPALLQVRDDVRDRRFLHTPQVRLQCVRGEKVLFVVGLGDRDQVLLMLVRERFPEWIEIY